LAGGVAIAQSLEEAQHPSMPENAIREVSIDHVAKVREIAQTIVQLSAPVEVYAGPQMGGTVSDEQNRELDLPDLDGSAARSANVDMPSGLSCPSCGGALWEREEAGVTQYRCYLGHNFALANLVADHWETVE